MPVMCGQETLKQTNKQTKLDFFSHHFFFFLLPVYYPSEVFKARLESFWS